MSGPPLTERTQTGDHWLKRPGRLSQAHHCPRLWSSAASGLPTSFDWASWSSLCRGQHRSLWQTTRRWP